MTTTIRKLAGIMAIAAASLVVLATTPASGQEDLDCDSPGVGDDIPVDPSNDPHDFDRDNDGIGCEADEREGTGTGTVSPAAPVPSPSAQLPHTGAATTVATVVGTLLVAVGVTALWASRRLRTRSLPR